MVLFEITIQLFCSVQRSVEGSFENIMILQSLRHSAGERLERKLTYGAMCVCTSLTEGSSDLEC